MTTLGDLFERYEDQDHGAYLSGGEVCSVAVSHDKKAVVCKVHFDEIVPRKALFDMEKGIRSAYGFSRVRIAPRYDLGSLTEPYLQSLRDYLVLRRPSAQGYLADSRWQVTDDGLSVSMLSTGAEYLSTDLRQLPEMIRTETGLECPVNMVHVDEEAERKFDEKTAEKRAERLQKAAAAEASAPAQEKPKKEEPSTAKKEKSYRPRKSFAVKKNENVLFGKLFDQPVVSIREAIGAVDSATIRGEVFFVEHREIKSKNTGREWIKVGFDITDWTSSMRVSKFMAKEKAGELMDVIKTGMYLTVQGKISYDTYEKETILEPTGIVLSQKPERQDTAQKKRVELHLHTNMSTMDGISPMKNLMKRAKSWGHTAIAVTDHGVAQAFPDAMHAIERNGIDLKVLYGVEAYYVDDSGGVSVVKGRYDAPLDETFVCFDTETTGLKPEFEEITEIAAVKVRGGEVLEEFQTYVNPHKPIPANITELTGISDETVADAPDLSDALPAFLEFAGDLPLVAHNAGFDMAFVNKGCERLGIQRDFTSIDTVEMSKILFPDMARHRLDSMAKALKVGPFDHHRASEDAAVLGRIFIKLIEKMRTELHAEKISDINPLLAGLKAKTGSLKNLRRYHFIILAKNQAGLKNLYKLISYSHLKYYNKKPIMPRSELIRHREGLIFGSACEAGELFSALIGGASHEELLRIADFYDYLEIQPIGNNKFLIANGTARDEEDLRNYNRQILAIADELGKPCVATGDVHFLEPQDEAFRRILMAGMGFKDADNQAPLYLKTTDEMLEEFSYLGEDRAMEVVVTNTNLIADWCDTLRPVPRENYPPKMDNSAEELETMCYEKAKRMYGDPLPEKVQARLERELGSIIGNGYDVMYMIAQKLVAKSLEDGYLVGSRGSVGSSLVAFMSDITEVNSLAPHYLCPDCHYIEWHENEGYGCGVDLPEKKCPNCGAELRREGFSIPFETFLGFNGDKVPDIDLNFSGEYQPKIHWYTGELFGHDHVFRAGTIGTVAEKTAYGYVKKYMDERGIQAGRAEENRLTAGCTGIKRTTGQHPGGIVVVPKEVDIYDFCPVQHPADDPNSDIITTHFEYHSIDENLLKLDELGHDDPTIIKHLEELTGVNAREIPLNDPDVMSLFTSNKALHYVSDEPDPILGDLGCIAVPEFGTKFVRGMVRDTKPTSFDELLCISGLSHGTDVWLGNAQTLVEQGVPLKECICCRDDIMNYLLGKGVEPKLSFQTMESVRKGKGLKPEMEEAMRAQDVPEWYIDSCKKIKYMFPKAHAVAYVMMAFRIAWFKVHKPLAFYSAYFSIRAKGFDASCMIRGDEVCMDKIHELQQKTREKTISAAENDMMTTLEVVHEFYRRGFVFQPMDIYKSDATTFLVTENGLIPPFTSMPGIGEQAALSIVEERKNGPFLSQEEVVIRCPKVSKGVVELLGQIGALADMPASTQVSLF
ncbi:PolC-type DNA polymerase III [Butyricicoccus sp.]|uniref:PolC-type DNA polymerase III n=1 Tax=Butyricicoccus sp. TaxID=2049021 RepID=UPI003F1479EC